MPQPKVDLANQVQGILPAANGGTGGTSIFPDQSGHAGEALLTDGVNVSWRPLDVGTF